MQTLTLRVSFPDNDSIWRAIELTDDQTLEQLHLAIQSAFSWQADHLYSFFMSGKPWDDKTEYRVPEEGYLGLDQWEIFEDQEAHDGPQDDPLAAFASVTDEDLEELMAEMAGKLGISLEKLQAMIEEPEEEPHERDVRHTPLSTLNLRRGRQFLYLFDYGDAYFFPILVQAVERTIGDVSHPPRIIAQAGNAPHQYPVWPDDELDQDADQPRDERDRDLRIAS